MVVSEGNRISEVKVILELVEVSQRGSLEEQGGEVCMCLCEVVGSRLRTLWGTLAMVCFAGHLWDVDRN